MQIPPRGQNGRALAGAIILAFTVAALALYPLAASAGSPATTSLAPSGERAIDMTEVLVSASAANLAALADLSVATSQSERSGYLRADVPTDQLHRLADRGISYERGRSFIQVEGGRTDNLSAYASVLGQNSANYAIANYNVVTDPITISGAPAGKTVTSVDVQVIVVYPCMNDLIITFNDPTTKGYNVWTYEGGCTANLNKFVANINTFNGDPINGVWKLYASQFANAGSGYVDDWSLRIYYAADVTATPTRTVGSFRIFLPVILQQPAS